MNREKEEQFLRQAMKALPAYAPSRRFNARVLAACAARKRAALPLPARIMVMLSLAWGAATAIIAAVLLALYAGDLASFLIHPPSLGDAASMGALKLWSAARLAWGLAGMAADSFANVHTLCTLILSTGLAAAVIVGISKERHARTH